MTSPDTLALIGLTQDALSEDDTASRRIGELLESRSADQLCRLVLELLGLTVGLMVDIEKAEGIQAGRGIDRWLSEQAAQST